MGIALNCVSYIDFWELHLFVEVEFSSVSCVKMLKVALSCASCINLYELSCVVWVALSCARCDLLREVFCIPMVAWMI